MQSKNNPSKQMEEEEIELVLGQEGLQKLIQLSEDDTVESLPSSLSMGLYT